MDNAIYIATSRQGVMFRKLDVIANNMANLNTPGFKENMLMATDWTVNNGNNQYISFTQDVSLFRDNRTGAMTLTNNPLDVAIDGEAYLTVQSPLGDRYSRAGSLKISQDGTLVTHDGYPLLDIGGQPIVIPEDARDVSFGDDGTVIVDNLPLSQLAVVQFADPQLLERSGQNLYRTEQAALPAENFRLAQGYLEESNVNAVEELGEMIKTNRGVGSVTKFVETAYDLQKRAMRAWAGNGNG